MTVNPEDRRVLEDGEFVVRSQPPERQAVNVAPMIWVLGISVGFSVIGLMLSWLLM